LEEKITIGESSKERRSERQVEPALAWRAPGPAVVLGKAPMRFIVMHKVDANMEAGGKPDARIIEEMGALVQSSLKEGVFTNGAGLQRSARRARLKRSGNDCTVTRGPYAGENELVASFAMISARSMDHALDIAQRWSGTLGDCEIEIGPVVEPWDLGLMAKPEGVPERFLLLRKSNAADDSATGAASRHLAGTKKLAQLLDGEGALLAADGLAPSSRGKRLPAGASGKRGWVDGPFAETKELIAGFSLLTLGSLDEAVQWANRYAAILGGDNEVDVRELDEA
jgi:hypothetical protein